MIIYSSFRALATIFGGFAAWALLSNIAPHTAWTGIAMFLVGIGLLAIGRRLARPYRVDTVAGVTYRRENHSVVFIPVWVWGIIAMILAIPLTVHPF